MLIKKLKILKKLLTFTHRNDIIISSKGGEQVLEIIITVANLVTAIINLTTAYLLYKSATKGEK